MGTDPPESPDHLPPLICPNCRAPVSLVTVRFRRSFACPDCRAALTVPDRYARFLALRLLVVSIAAAYAVGARGGFLVMLAPAFFVPIAMVGGLIYRVLFPPSLIEVADVSGGWAPLGSPAPGTEDDDGDQPVLVSDDTASLLRSPVIAAAAFASAGGLVAPFIDDRTLPVAKWFWFFGAAMFAWAGARVFPDVWENRREDKTAVLFVAAFVLCMLFGMWDSLHWR